MSNTKEILNNVIWLVEALDEEALGEVGEIGRCCSLACWFCFRGSGVGEACVASISDRQENFDETSRVKNTRSQQGGIRHDIRLLLDAYTKPSLHPWR